VALLGVAVAADLLAIGTRRRGVHGLVATALAWLPGYLAVEIWYDQVGLVDLPASSRLPALLLSTLAWTTAATLGRFVGVRVTAEPLAPPDRVGHRHPRGPRLRRSADLVMAVAVVVAVAVVMAVAVVVAIPVAASAVPQIDDVGAYVGADLGVEGERLVLNVPRANPGDVVTVIGPQDPSCQPEECVEAGGRQWLGRLEQHQPGRFEGTPREGGTWRALWYVGGDQVWISVVDRSQAGPIQLEALVPAKPGGSLVTVVALGVAAFGLIVISLAALARALGPLRPDYLVVHCDLVHVLLRYARSPYDWRIS
jgi:hypothetical protein